MSVTKLASRGVYHAMGKATEQLHQENFPHALMEVFRRAITYDYSMILIYPIDSIPQRIYEDNISELTEKKGRMRYYVDGMYLLDPLYQLILQQPDPGFYSLREIAPDNFYRSEFFKHHFCNTFDALASFKKLLICKMSDIINIIDKPLIKHLISYHLIHITGFCNYAQHSFPDNIHIALKHFDKKTLCICSKSFNRLRHRNDGKLLNHVA